MSGASGRRPLAPEEMNPDKTTDIATAEEVDGLADIMRRRNWVWGWLLAGMPIVYGAGKLLGEQAVVVTIVWVAVFFGLISRHLFARCPRCHEFFNWSQRRRHHFADKCTHCGVELQAPRSTNDNPANVETRMEQMRRTRLWNLIVTVFLWSIVLGVVYAAWAWYGSVK